MISALENIQQGSFGRVGVGNFKPSVAEENLTEKITSGCKDVEGEEDPDILNVLC